MMRLRNLRNRQGMPGDLNYEPTPTETAWLTHFGYTCSCCGFQSKPTEQVPSGYMELINIDNHVSAFCSPCASSQRLGREVNGTTQHGLILHLPELTQARLMQIVLICDVAVANDLPYFEQAWLLSSKISDAQADETVFPFFASPGSIQSLVTALSIEATHIIEHQDKLFGSLRYYPVRDEYEQIYKYYYAVNPEHFQYPHSDTPLQNAG